MEILVVGDSHLTGRNPIARKDDLVEVQFEKWEYIIDIANENDVPIVHTGDIFNVAIIANSLLTKFGEMLTKLIHPLYFVWGNHDLMYHSYDMWDRTSLGVLWKNNSKVKHIMEFHFDYDIWWSWLDWGANEIYWVKEGSELFLSHKAIVNTKLTGINSWILEDKEFCLPINEIQKYNFKLAICGHWHKKYMYKYKGTKVINPGPIIRRTVEEWFIPSVMLLNTDTLIHKKFDISDQEPEQVLSKTHIDQKFESMTDNVLKFVDSLKNKKFSHKKSFLKTLIFNLDQHELPNKVETLIRTTIADLIEKGVIDESI